MPPSSVETIYPCPFSKGYGIPVRQAWLLLKIFFSYRFVSASLFVLLYFLRWRPAVPDVFDAPLYQFASMAYFGICLLSAPLVFRRLMAYSHLAQLFIFTDIFFVTVLMHACGGVGSGVGDLLAVSIAAGGLLVGGRCALLFAAMASLAVLTEQVYGMQAGAFDWVALNYSGLLGIGFFAIALIAMILAQRVEQSSSLARRHAQTIERLEELNQYIIQHLQSGILIVDERQFIVLSNHSALRLLGVEEAPTHLADVSPLLQQAFLRWQENAEHDFAIVPLAGGGEIQLRFSGLNMDAEPLYLLLIEDISLYNRRLQQSKLASLGRLTASIAHEIRNPLSAISHAGQLLSEAPHLKPEDLRLTDIIQNHCQRVNNMIEDILKLSRRRPSHRQKVALEQWLPAYVQEKNLAQAKQAGVFRLTLKQTPLNALIDPDHLKQILDNLLGNALKYGCPEAGGIEIEVDRSANGLCIRVLDNGPGIGQNDLPHLFEPFFTTSRQGTGLGLYISRELAELNQAELSYASFRQKSCFTLALPNADNVVIEI